MNMKTNEKWVKKTPYGDYRDVEQNHKFETNAERTSLVNRRKNAGHANDGKPVYSHPGSKKMHALKYSR